MRRRILLLSLGLTTLVVLAFAIPLAFLVSSSVEQRALKAGADEASSIAIFLRTGSPSDTSVASYLASLSTRSARRSCVQKPDGTVLGEQPPGGVTGDAANPAGTNTGNGNGNSTGTGTGNQPGGYGAGGSDDYSTPATVSKAKGGQIALLDVAVGSSTYVVRTYVPADSYQDSVHRWWMLLGGSSVLLLLLSVAAAEIVTRRLVRPLVRTADTAHRLSAGEVGARAPQEGPAEVAEVGIALNRLADRIEELITEERETVADLSHRLRTPLTALRLDVDGLSNRADADRLGEHVSSLERSLTAVIRAARRPRSSALVPVCDARAVVADRVAFWFPLAEDQGRPVEVTLPPDAIMVRCGAEDLSAALDALLENVIAHTPEGTGLSIHVSAAAPGAVIDVIDHGPGLPASATVRGRSDRGSTGLGLSIARRTAEASGGELVIGTGPGPGAVVTLRLGAA